MEFKDAVIVKEVTLQDARLADSSTQLIKNKSDDIKDVKLENIEIEEVRLQDNRHADSRAENIKPNNEVVVVDFATNEPTQKKIFEKVEIEPVFPEGDVAWRRYLERNLNPRVMSDNGAPAGIYRVMVLYVVNSDGSLSDVRALTNHGYGMEAEAIRLIKNSPKWIPAIQNGKKINAYRKQPVTFQLVDNKNQKLIP
jgi:protein TonB